MTDARNTTYENEGDHQYQKLRNQNEDLHTQVRDLNREVDRFRLLYQVTRNAYADLIAAGWATLGAYAEGEPDALAYLHDELPRPPEGHPLSRSWKTWGWCR